MDQVGDWLNALFRWLHVVFAIMWIGHAFMFNHLDSVLVPPREEPDPDKPTEGDLWMVHGGGFYHLNKVWYMPQSPPGGLIWFKWEAAGTWLSGFALLIVVFYLGGGVYLIDPIIADIGLGAAVGISIGSLLLGWIIYDLLMISPLGAASGWAQAAVFLPGLAAIAYALCNLLSGRAAFLHVGALIGTIMTANVWMRIIPPMKRMVAAAERGEKVDFGTGKKAKQRSRHNNYLVFPLLFLMISNHYPALYGHPLNWAVLMLVVIALVGIRHVLNVHHVHGGPAEWGPAAFGTIVAVPALIWLVAIWKPAVTVAPAPAPVAGTQAIDPATVGSVRGVVHLDQAAPAPKELRLLGGCDLYTDGPVLDDAVISKDGRLQNAFVYVSGGLDGWTMPDPPTSPVIVDQTGCMYRPKVVGVRVGQPVKFLNSDPLPHNVRAVAKANPVFNDMMATKGLELDKRFLRPEVMVQAKCDVHPWMSGFIGVVDHPFFAVSDEKGVYKLEGLPPGEYELTAWHQVYGEKKLGVTISSGNRSKAPIHF